MFRITASAAALVLALALSVGQARAQMPIDLVGGVTIADISTDDFDTESTTGFFLAVGTAFPVGERFVLAPYVGYVQKGASFGEDGEASYDYIEIPVFLGTRFPLGEQATLGISAGPHVAFQINCDEDGFDCTEFEEHKSTDFGLIGGVNIGLPMGSQQVGFGVTYELGLTDIYDTPEGVSYKNRVIYIHASIALGGS